MDGTAPTRILITRLSHIGDCLLTLPMLNAIRQQLPNAYIAWAVESPTQKLLSLHPGIDELIMIPKSWAGRPKNWIPLRRELRSHQFDVAIDPQGITKSAALGWLSGAKHRVGIRGRWGRELSPWLNNRLVKTESPHIVDRSIELLSGLGLTTDINPTFELPICPQADAAIGQWIDETSNATTTFDSRRFAIINPGGSWASKRWEMDRLGAVAAHLTTNHQLTSVVVWAGDEEYAMAEEVVRHSNGHAIMAPPTTLRELAAISARATFFVGGDTGPLHLASAVGTPCVGLYGTTRPIDSGAYDTDQHVGHLAVQAYYQSGSCRERRAASNDAMRAITVNDVVQACDQMIENLSEHSARRVA